MSYQSVSVLTLVRGRQQHLDHLIAGLCAQVRQPDELVVAYMQDNPPRIPSHCPFTVNCVHVGGEPMPLAKARNRAAQAATGDLLIFLDVDCIPDTQLAKRALETPSLSSVGVFLPEVRYLPASTKGWLRDSRTPDYPALSEEGRRHPAKPDLDRCSVTEISDFGELWGLAFILPAETWATAGGMDEDYFGYGAEETDFGRRLERAKAKLFWLGGTVCYHQHHPVHKPPLQHFDSIVRNARLFHSKWGDWCMDYWLDDFARRGLLSRDDDEIQLIRTPTPQEISATRQGPEVRFS